MNLLAGLEKFGLGQSQELNILDDGRQKVKQEAKGAQTAVKLSEQDFLLNHKVTCAVCGQTFYARKVIGSKLKRMEPDDDLRPNHEYIDTLKYGVYACPHCGYAALVRGFDHVSAAQRKWIREAVCANFRPVDEPKQEVYTYDYAVDRYKLALLSTMAKKGKLSEKAYICLNIAWLRRRQYDLLPDDTSYYQQKREAVKEEFEGFYQQAYEGFLNMLFTETAPYCCGLDSNTVDYILAQMAVYYRKYDVASKMLSHLLGSTSTPRRMKDKCIDLKDRVLNEIRQS